MGKSVKEGIMPKEFINNRYYGQTARSHEKCEASPETCERLSCVGQPVALDDSAVKVGWTKDLDHVEIAVVHHRDVADGAGSEHDDGTWHAQFDRAGINRLIRTLRRARDDAFGRDE